MFQSSITTSKENKEVVTMLTNKWGLGTENVIARLALSYSLNKGVKLDIKDIQDAKGKAYSSKILFGNYVDFYVALICQHYDLHKTDKNISKYMKLHIDDGLSQLKDYATSDGIDFLITNLY